ncbi:unnamed protein product [Lactuca virosa]|uniref:Uncharacterized protein n=1 Tax=Lactuca virosa TaxID=75947 RepID=A0AAU9PJP2_9ASTR|nr:unnamed protein product [Lactuca virosa]
MSPSMQAALESTVTPKRIGGKCEEKFVEESVSNKPSKRQTKRKKKQVKSLDVNIQVNNYVPTTTLIPVQTEDSIPVQTDKEVYHNILQEPIINLSQSQSQSPTVPPFSQPSTTTPVPSTTIPIPTTTILIQTVVQTPPASSIRIINPLPPPIFTQSTTTTTAFITATPPVIQNEERVSNDNDDFHVTKLFQTFFEPFLDASLLDDESDLNDETAPAPTTRKDYQILNRKLNALVRRDNSFSLSNFQNLMITHENTLKMILGESRRLFADQAKLIDEVTYKVQTALNTSNNVLSKVDSIASEVKEYNTSILSANTKHNQGVINSINTLVSHYDNETDLVDKLTVKELNLRSLNL